MRHIQNHLREILIGEHREVLAVEPGPRARGNTYGGAVRSLATRDRDWFIHLSKLLAHSPSSLSIIPVSLHSHLISFSLSSGPIQSSQSA